MIEKVALERCKISVGKNIKILTDDSSRDYILQVQIAADYEMKYHSLDAEGKQLATELGTAQRLLEAREREIELLRDTIE